MSVSLSKKEARQIIVSAQKFDGSLKSAQKTLEHLGYIQIDTISVVERAHHHIFWSRYRDYKTSKLDQLIKKRKAFEYWSHAASYLPMKDYACSFHVKDYWRKRFQRKPIADPKVMKKVLKRIREEGPLSSKDFKDERTSKKGWWDWKPAKRALERLFMEGDLDIAERRGFQKVYDLPERVIPGFASLPQPSEEEYIHYLLMRVIKSSGLATLSEITHLRKSDFQKKVKKELAHLVESGKLIEVKIEKLPTSYYALKKSLKVPSAQDTNVQILSPFDNLTIHRGRLKDIFDFDYQIECYVPAPKRKYGYFTLPILKGDEFIGRIDLKAHRKESQLEVLSCHPEPQVKKTAFKSELKSSLLDFAHFNDCSKIINA